MRIVADKWLRSNFIQGAVPYFCCRWASHADSSLRSMSPSAMKLTPCVSRCTGSSMPLPKVATTDDAFRATYLGDRGLRHSFSVMHVPETSAAPAPSRMAARLTA